MKRKSTLFKTFILLFLAALIVVPGQLAAQRKKKKPKEDEGDHEWDYTIVRNSPSRVVPFSIFLDPAIVQICGLEGSGLGALLGANIAVTDNIQVYGGFQYNYLVIGTAANSEDYLPATVTPNFNFEVTGTWFFSDETRKADEQVLLYSESGGYRTIINHVANINLRHERRFGARLGFMSMNYSIGTGEGNFNGYLTSDPTQTNIDLNQSGGSTNLLTNVHSNMIVLGLCTEKESDYKLKFNNGTVREGTRTSGWHADLLISAGSSFDNVIEQDSMNKVYNLNKYTSKAPIGVRVGYQTVNVKPFGSTFGIDFGAFPGGVASPTFFFAFKVGFAFSPSMD